MEPLLSDGVLLDEPAVPPGVLVLGPAAALPDGPGLPAVLPLPLGLAPEVLPLGAAPMVDELLLPDELGVELELGELELEVEPGVELELGLVLLVPGVAPGGLAAPAPELAPPAPELAPPEVCAMAMPPIASAAAVARVVRVFFLVFMSCSFTGNP